VILLGRDIFIRMYKHLTGNYQPNFNLFVDVWCRKNIPNYQHLDHEYEPGFSPKYVGDSTSPPWDMILLEECMVLDVNVIGLRKIHELLDVLNVCCHDYKPHPEMKGRYLISIEPSTLIEVLLRDYKVE